MEDRQPLLSICIPIYDRLPYLERMLGHFLKDKDLFEEKIDLFISDNASREDLSSCVERYRASGLRIRYHRNEKNIGADNNFLFCFSNARGKYCWLLGSDDTPRPGLLKEVTDCLEAEDYGLFHLTCYSESGFGLRKYTSSAECLCDINYWVTFISGNIINSRLIKEVDADEYRGSFMIQVPFFVEACVKSPLNAILECKAFDGDNDSASNGGYNFFQVFVVNLFSIYRAFLGKGLIDANTFDRLRKREFKEFLLPQILDCLILRKDNNYKLEGSWVILFREYGREPYFYTGLLSYPLRRIARRAKRIVKHLLCR